MKLLGGRYACLFGPFIADCQFQIVFPTFHFSPKSNGIEVSSNTHEWKTCLCLKKVLFHLTPRRISNNQSQITRQSLSHWATSSILSCKGFLLINIAASPYLLQKPRIQGFYLILLLSLITVLSGEMGQNSNRFIVRSLWKVVLEICLY